MDYRALTILLLWLIIGLIMFWRRRRRTYLGIETEPHVIVPIFYGTDRTRGPIVRGKLTYGPKGDRRLDMGRMNVSVPRKHRKCKIERPVWWKGQFSERPGEHLMILSVTVTEKEEMLTSVAENADTAATGEALLFIHGFNVTFEQAALRTAQLAYDLAFRGTVLMYSWPSTGRIAGYAADYDAAERSAPHLEQFLSIVAEVQGIRRVHIVAHSMGNRALLSVLRDFVAGHQARQLILAAPDVDAETFDDQIAARISAKTERTTLYASRKDLPLAVSRIMRFGHPRLGQAGRHLTVIAGIDTVDASRVRTDLLGHGYFAATRELLSDIHDVIACRPPEQRNLAEHTTGELRYWELSARGATQA